MARIQFKGIYKSYGVTPVIHGIDLEIADKEFVVILGPSGCGKSTLLRMIAGLESITDGQILIADRLVNDLEPRERDVAMVFQNYALYPHMSVAENISYSMRLSRRSKIEIDKAVAEVAVSLGLTDLLTRRPGQLSGGQRQRVALGRAIVRRPKVFLFDEPLSNLDAILRSHMRAELKRLHLQLGATSVLVTHDQIEAMTMASRIVVMNKGHVEQIGTPMDIYRRPATEFVAKFVGSPQINIAPGYYSQPRGGVMLDSGGFVPKFLPLAVEGQRLHLGVRPEHLRRCGDGSAWLSGRMDIVEELGSSSLAHVQTDGGFMVMATDPLAVPVRGEAVGMIAKLSDVHVFDAKSGQRVEAEAVTV